MAPGDERGNFAMPGHWEANQIPSRIAKRSIAPRLRTWNLRIRIANAQSPAPEN